MAGCIKHNHVLFIIYLAFILTPFLSVGSIKCKPSHYEGLIKNAVRFTQHLDRLHQHSTADIQAVVDRSSKIPTPRVQAARYILKLRSMSAIDLYRLTNKETNRAKRRATLVELVRRARPESSQGKTDETTASVHSRELEPLELSRLETQELRAILKVRQGPYSVDNLRRAELALEARESSHRELVLSMTSDDPEHRAAAVGEWHRRKYAAEVAEAEIKRLLRDNPTSDEEDNFWDIDSN